MAIRHAWALAAVASGFALASVAAAADPVEDFYKGRTLDLYIGTSEGPSVMTSYGRNLADFVGKHTPGTPKIIVRYMPGAAGIKAANFVYGIGPQDGTVFGFISRSFVLAPLLVDQAQFVATKLNFIGSPVRDTSVATVWTAASKVRSIEDARSEELVVGGTALSSDTGLYPTLLNQLIGTKFKVVTGYKSVSEVDLAMERGEVQGKVGGTWSSLNSGRTADWVSTGKVKVLFQLGLTKSPKLPSDIPLVLDYTRNVEDRQLMSLILAPTAVGHSLFMGPGVPPERITAIQAAFKRAIADPDFIDVMKRQNIWLDPVLGEDMKKIVDEIYSFPPAVLKRAKEIVPPS